MNKREKESMNVWLYGSDMDKWKEMFRANTKCAFIISAVTEMISFYNQEMFQQSVLRWVLIKEFVDEKELLTIMISDPEQLKDLKEVLPIIKDQYVVEVMKFKHARKQDE